MIHKPVMLKECVDLLATKDDGTYFDGTAGFGGHSTEILKRISSKGQLIATDKDQTAFQYCRNKFAADKRYSIYNTSFKNIDTISKIEFICRLGSVLVSTR
ncbi:MAG: 16S rRNA (cytosine1402-N4)-methyltransferase [Ignavibacteria bacterium]|nr:MAG: 16S rRNA (cytosine1402-N4)-methyltransferase [Ignavibacteria bacterium]